MNRIKFGFLFCILILFSVSAYANKKAIYPLEVLKILEQADDNRTELEKALRHYSSTEDSLKFKAVCFLISNMERHSYVKYALKDSNDTEVYFSIFDYPTYEALLQGFDSLETRFGTLDFKKKEDLLDLQTITADFLIQQIDLSFKAWREKTWAQKLSFQEFCEYVLPYRGSNEPLENWRKVFLKRYKNIEKRMKDPSDAIEAANIINDDLKSWFRFDPRFYFHPTDQGLAEFLKIKLGRCEDMTNLTIYAMRANGLAVTSDYTPYWANAGNNHAWNAIVTPDGKVVPFMGAEANPGHYRLANKLAKVYRKMYSQNKENLAFYVKGGEKIPPYLGGKSYIDVTADYVKVADGKIALEGNIPDTAKVAYICVFNSGEWKAIQWGEISDGSVVFKEMGLDIAYLPALYLEEKIVPSGAPFILNSDSSIIELEAQVDSLITVQLTSTTCRKQEISTDGVMKTFLNPGQNYELFYWLNGWQSLGKQIAEDKPLVFEKVPVGALYWLVAEGSDREERIFTIEEGKQVWW
jgi:hypothetical protein